MLGLARRLGLARNTVQARLDRLDADGLLGPAGRRLVPAAFEHGMLGFMTLEVTQGHLDEVVEQLARIPEVLEAHGITGDGDLLCRVVATDAEHLYEVVDRVLHCTGVSRTRTSLAMRELLPYRLEPLLETRIDHPQRT